MTLVEVVIALAVMGLLLPAIAGILYLMMSVPFRGGNTLETSLEADQSLEVISGDARSAVGFSPSAGPPDYGTFSWTDYTVVPPISDTVRYYYSPTNTSLVRQETLGSDVRSRAIARNILSYGDVSFVSVAGYAVSVTVRSTITTATSATGVITKEVTGLVTLRSQQVPTGVTLSPAGDSYVNQNSPTTNYGTATSLSVRSTTTGTPDTNQRTFIQFGLSSVPSSSTIQSARLRLYLYQAPAASRNYDAHRVTATWSETGITWNNQPGVAASATSTTATGITANSWIEWDVTSDVQAFVNASLTNYGWRIKDQTESDPAGDFSSLFRSKENTGAALDPQLVVDYL